MKKNLPQEDIDTNWNVKNITIDGENITNVPDEELYKLVKRVMNRVCNNEGAKTNASKTKVNLFHIEAEMDDGSVLSIPLIVKRYKDSWCYLTPEYLMKE